MLLFHGTGGDRTLVEQIFAEGLRPTDGRAWAHKATGHDSLVFACTSPVGSKNGDPIHYARSRTYRDRESWLVVIDLPPSAEPLVVGAIPNAELERYWLTEAFVAVAVDYNFQTSRAVIAESRARGVGARELLALQVKSTAEGLCKAVPDAATLVQFETAYIRARERDKAKVAASYGLTIPPDFAQDSHYPYCIACMHNLFEVVIVAADVVGEFQRGSFMRLDMATLGAMLDALGRWFASYDRETIERAIGTKTAVWQQLQHRLPPPRDQVPRTFWPDFATADVAARIREPDTQTLMTGVPPDRIVGAIHLGNRDRLSKLVRPSGGQTLAHNLWHLANELHATWARTGRATIVR